MLLDGSSSTKAEQRIQSYISPLGVIGLSLDLGLSHDLAGLKPACSSARI